MIRIGITERGDAGLQFDEVVKQYNNKNIDGVILITKQPSILLERIDELKQLNFILHCTITGYSSSVYGFILEPKVPATEKEFDAYLKLGEIFGFEKIVLRIDPIIPIFPFLKFTHYLLEMYPSNISKTKPRIRISFIDVYNHIYKTQDFSSDDKEQLHKAAAEFHLLFSKGTKS